MPSQLTRQACERKRGSSAVPNDRATVALLPALLQTGAPPALVSKAALTAEAAAAAAERERREARYAALFYGRSSGGRQQGDVPEELPFNRISSQVGALL